MKKTFFKAAIFFAAALCFAGGKKDGKSQEISSGGAVPAWVLDVKSAYPDSKYIAQTGSGALKEDAKDKALSLVAAYFRSQVAVVSTSSSVLTEKRVGTNAAYTSDKVFSSDLALESDIELLGVDYAYYFSEKENVNYCVAYMDRAKTWKMIEGDLETALKLAQSNWQNAESAGDIFSKIRLYAKNRSVWENFQEKYYFARVVDYSKAEKYKEVENLYLESEKKILGFSDKGAVKMGSMAGSAKDVEKKLRQVLESEGFTVTSGKAAYTANVDCDMAATQQGEYVITYPKISVEIFEGEKTVYSFSQVGGRVVGIDAQNMKSKAIKKIEEMLEDMFK